MKTIELICAVCTVALLSTAASAANMVPNPSFENGGGSRPDSWHWGASGDSTHDWLTNDASQGSRCMQLRVETVGDADIRCDTFNVEDHDTLYWSFAYKFLTNSAGNLSGTPRIQLRCFRGPADQNHVGEDNYTFASGVTNMGGWVTIPTRAFILPAGTTNVDIRAVVDIWEEFTGTFCIDVVAVDPVPEPLTMSLMTLCGFVALRFRG